MDFEYKNGNNVTDTVNLLISILYRYPEVSTVNFNPSVNTLKFGFLLSNKISTEELVSLKKQMIDNMEIFNLLEKRQPDVININNQYIDNYTIIEIERDVNTLVQGEISLTVLSLQQMVKNNIIIEKPYSDKEDEQLQEEIIDSMLLRVRGMKGNEPLLAFREEGRVLVFNM